MSEANHLIDEDYEPVGIENARTCQVCRKPMAGGQWGRHHLCGPDSVVGRQCSCPPGCTSVRKAALVGDGERDYNPGCAVCSKLAGTPHVDTFGRKKAKNERGTP